MNKKLAVLAVCLFVLSGCGSPVPENAQPPSDRSTPAREELTVSDEATCQTLLGSDGGLVSESGQFLADVSELSDSSAKEAEDLASALDGVAKTASDEIQKLLVVMQEPLRDLAIAHETGTSFELEPSRFKAAANEVITICAKFDTSGATPGTATAPESEPDAVPPAPSRTAPISGDYAADLASLGSVPDDLEAYKAFMKESLCESDLDDRLTGFHARVRSRVGTDPDAERANLGRVNVAYLCPERSDDLEQALAELATE